MPVADVHRQQQSRPNERRTIRTGQRIEQRHARARTAIQRAASASNQHHEWRSCSENCAPLPGGMRPGIGSRQRPAQIGEAAILLEIPHGQTVDCHDSPPRRAVLYCTSLAGRVSNAERRGVSCRVFAAGTACAHPGSTPTPAQRDRRIFSPRRRACSCTAGAAVANQLSAQPRRRRGYARVPEVPRASTRPTTISAGAGRRPGDLVITADVPLGGRRRSTKPATHRTHAAESFKQSRQYPRGRRTYAISLDTPRGSGVETGGPPPIAARPTGGHLPASSTSRPPAASANGNMKPTHFIEPEQRQAIAPGNKRIAPAQRLRSIGLFCTQNQGI